MQGGKGDGRAVREDQQVGAFQEGALAGISLI